MIDAYRKNEYHINSCYLFIYLYIYFIIVVQVQLFPFSHHHFPPPYPPLLTTLNPHPLWLGPWVLYTCSLMNLLLLSPINPIPLPLWLLSVCSLFQCLWLYFACLLVLLIRFYLKVRSYGICLVPSGLIHLA